jgi:tryptophan synthase alpha chain
LPIQPPRAGVDGTLVVDVPPEEAMTWSRHCAAGGWTWSTCWRRHRTPSASSASVRSPRVSSTTSSVKGVTGAGNLDVEAVTAKLAEIRARIALPVGVGFGIKDAASAASVASVADAVIVGSAIVQRIENLADTPQRIPETIGASSQNCELPSTAREGPDAAWA